MERQTQNNELMISVRASNGRRTVLDSFGSLIDQRRYERLKSVARSGMVIGNL